MSAAEQRKMLEALMGAEALGGVPFDTKHDDPKVCRNYLCGLCPHTLFTNTKMDLGPCQKIHSDKLKTDYEASVAANPRSSFEHEHFRSLETFMGDCDRKVRQAQGRLDKTPGDDEKTLKLMDDIKKLEQDIADKMLEVEALGEEGKVSESMEALKDAEKLKVDKAAMEKEISDKGDRPSQQQKLRVCETCSAYLSVFDSDRRLADHFNGKMHMGYVQIRERVKELREKFRPQGHTLPGNLPPGAQGTVEYNVSSRDDRFSRGGPPSRGGGGGYRGGYDRERERGYSGSGGGGGYGGGRGGNDRDRRSSGGYDRRRDDRDRGYNREYDRERRRSRSRSRSPRRERH